MAAIGDVAADAAESAKLEAEVDALLGDWTPQPADVELQRLTALILADSCDAGTTLDNFDMDDGTHRGTLLDNYNMDNDTAAHGKQQAGQEAPAPGTAAAAARLQHGRRHSGECH